MEVADASSSWEEEEVVEDRVVRMAAFRKEVVVSSPEALPYLGVHPCLEVHPYREVLPYLGALAKVASCEAGLEASGAWEA